MACWLVVFWPVCLVGAEPFSILVVDEESGRGVPLVVLETTHHVRLVTDSAGLAAFREPSLMDQRVFFTVESHGYEFPKDNFGYHGKALEVVAGGHATLKVRRVNIAERLYRTTGAGIYRDSVLLGRDVPLKQPLLNAQVTGSDSVVTAIFRERLYWFWGDTLRASYPLGNLHVTGAVSDLPASGGLAPSVGVRYEYFVDETGFARAMAKLRGDGATWISGLVVLADPDSGVERMFAHYVKVRRGLEICARGLAEFDVVQGRFLHVAAFPNEARFADGSHTLVHTDGGTKYVYYCHPFPFLRVPADPESLRRPERYEAFTCLDAGTGVDERSFQRLPNGSVRFAWTGSTAALRPDQEVDCVREGAFAEHDRRTALYDVETGSAVVAHRGSTYWNEYRRRWVMIATEIGGRSMLGEVWYAEADEPLGPWLYARRIVTHDRYSFYNPKHHPIFDEDGGRTIYFEGTYASTFSGNHEKTPRYDYNQILYRLDLADPRLRLPVAVYQTGPIPDRFVVGAAESSSSVAFWALDRATPDVVAVYEAPTEQGFPALRRGQTAELVAVSETPLFYALAPDHPSPPEGSVPLYEYRSRDGTRRAYASGESSPPELKGYVRESTPLVRVWERP